MCGIVGLVSFDRDRSIDRARLTRMRDVLGHRGPDGAGLWTEGPVGFGHRRLAIVDPAGGQQPMSNEDGSVWLVCNGEIYNHPILMPRLRGRGHTYRSHSDSETILHLYEELGDHVVDQLQGMFAFAIWDRRRARLLLARDRLGIKPLYVAVTDDELLFGSEIKAILAGGSVRPELREELLPELLATRFISGEDTCFQGIRRIEPGHVMTWSRDEGAFGRGAIAERRYWSLPAAADRDEPGRPLAEEAGRLREHLQAAVRRHLMSDVPLGVFLSGGLDSSALAALAAPMVQEPLRTFAVGFDDPATSELPYARRVAEAIGAVHREVVVTPRQYFDALPRLIWQEDEPIAFTSSVPLYFVSALAREDVKVALTGEGADELFLGYNRYRVTDWNARVGGAYSAMIPGGLRRWIRDRVPALPAPVRRYAARSVLALEPDIRSLFCDNFAVFSDSWRQRILAAAPAAGSRDPYAGILQRYDRAEGSRLDRLSRADLGTYLQELLMKQDQMSMAASIESRVPFLDDQFVAYAAGLPHRAKLRGWQTKAVLRAAVRDLLPPEILTRRKMGFPVPFGRWLRGDFWPVVEEFVIGPRAAARGRFDAGAVGRMAAAHRAGAADHGDRLWLLINLEIWTRLFCEGEDPNRVMRPVQPRKGSGYAGAMGEDGRALAPQYRRPAAQLPRVARAVAASPGRARHD
jgi:asparagine synthase (glutamine-hydrolysing)